MNKAEELDRTASAIWRKVQTEYPSAALERMEVFFEVARGRAHPSNSDPRRLLHSRIYMPGLASRPWWDPGEFALSADLQRRYDLMVNEALGLLDKPWLFSQNPGRKGFGLPNDPSSPLEGRWFCYYLQRHLRRMRIAAEHTPVALRTLDRVPPAREALFSFLGPQSHIKIHSDKVNLVITLYLPLFARGAWITFGGESRAWTDGRCMAADSTFFHESVNPSSHWRGLLLVDLWHPDLTKIEQAILERAVPPINDILRSGDQ